MKSFAFVLFSLIGVVAYETSPVNAGVRPDNTLSFNHVPLRTATISGNDITITDSEGRTFYSDDKAISVAIDASSSGTYADIVVYKAGERVGVFTVKQMTVYVRTPQQLYIWADKLYSALVYRVRNRIETEKLIDVELVVKDK